MAGAAGAFLPAEHAQKGLGINGYGMHQYGAVSDQMYQAQAPCMNNGFHGCSNYGNNGMANYTYHDQMKQTGFGGGYGVTSPYNGGFGGEYQQEHAEGYGWRQEYSQGVVPEYEAEALWSTAADEEFAQVHVFGPSGEQVPPAVTSFQQAQELFPEVLIHKLLEAGFAAPTPIQAHTWAIGVAGRDVIGIAKTGSGKTLAFLMPGFLKITQSRSRYPQLCVLAPTRELACQIEAEAEKFGRAAGIRTVCCYGGAPRGQQLGALRRGAQVIVACPGRLNDFIQSGSVSLGSVSYLVLDEADRMLDMGFEPQIRQVIKEVPEQRQTLLFTATWPREVRSLASEFLKRPIHVQTGAVHEMTVNKDIEQRVTFCSDEADKAQQLLQILHSLGRGDRCLIFCEMKRSCEILANDLMQYHGVPAVRIHGDMAQYERTAALEAFKSGHSPILCATDVAARGLDIKGVTCVINYDAAGSGKDYVHRIGRTGRAGHKGLAYSLLILHKEDKKAQEIASVLVRSGAIIPPELERFVQRRDAQRKGDKGKGKGRKGKDRRDGKGKDGRGKDGKGRGKGKGGGKGRAWEP